MNFHSFHLYHIMKFSLRRQIYRPDSHSVCCPRARQREKNLLIFDQIFVSNPTHAESREIPRCLIYHVPSWPLATYSTYMLKRVWRSAFVYGVTLEFTKTWHNAKRNPYFHCSPMVRATWIICRLLSCYIYEALTPFLFLLFFHGCRDAVDEPDRSVLSPGELRDRISIQSAREG